MDFLRRATTPAVTSVAGLFGLFSSEPTKENKYAIEQAIKAMDESPGNKTILDIETIAAQKTAEKAKLNRKLTNLLNGKRNSTRLSGERSTASNVHITKAAAVNPKAAAKPRAAAAAVVKPKAAAAAVALNPKAAAATVTVNLKAGPGKSIDKLQVNESKADDKVKTTSTDAAHATMDAINANLALDNELSKEKPSDELNAEILKKENDTLMQAFIAAQGDITAFRKQCVDEAVSQFQEALRTYGIQVVDETSGAIMGKIAGSWSELLISSKTPDSSIYLSYKTFFFRVNQAIDALLTQCIFLSTKYPPPLPSPPATYYIPPDLESRKVQVGPCWYIVGPILDFQNIEGRIFIYVKCYSDATNGIYFWVYGSQSEGFNRVFFKLDPFGSIEKGFDYTQGTFVHLPLQMALCNYYKTHRIETPKLLDTLAELNSFMSSMPYLQQDSRTNSYHRYMIDDSFASIIKRGFPLNGPLFAGNMIHSDWSHVVNMIRKKGGKTDIEIAIGLHKEWETQCALYFPDNNTHPHYEFSRRKMGYGTTCPYIFCFTTCGLVQSCPMFKLFLSANSYKNTFWCQGFQNYTEMLRNAGLSEGEAPPNRKILSPVLHVVIGALLQDPDMRLSTLRNIILNIGITSDAKQISQRYNEATKAFMTVGTGPKFGDPGTSLYLPNIPIRSAALLAFKKIRYKTNDIYKSFKDNTSSPPDEDRKIVHLEVQKKIIMIKILAARLLGPPPLPKKMTLFSQEMQKLYRVANDGELLRIQAIQTAATQSTIAAFRTSISTSDVNVFTSEKYYTDAQTNATKFIEASPEAAAAALFGYISSPKKHNEPTEFEQHLTHFALLCLKKEWIRGIMDDAYHALEGVFNPENAIYNYLGIDGEFHQFVPTRPVLTSLPYVLISSFDEVRKEDTSPTNPERTELNVTVVTFAHIYRVDCGYHEIFADGSDVFKSMSIIYQISTTVVYTRENPSRILYAVTHRTPLVCLPDLPDALKYLIEKKINALMEELKNSGNLSEEVIRFTSGKIIFNHKEILAGVLVNITEILSPPKKTLKVPNLSENQKILLTQIQQLLQKLIQLLQAEELLTSPYTLLATYQRVASYGALFAGKMMEYFFGGENGYYQLPYFFKNFDKFLKVCHQYDSTVLMYLPNVPPYDLLDHHPSALELLPQSIESYFTTLGITFNKGVSGVDQKTYIQTKLNEYGPHIQAISEYLTKDFMPKPIDSGSSMPESLASVSTASSTSSTASTASRRDKDLEKLLPYLEGTDEENLGTDEENLGTDLYFLVFGFPRQKEDDSDSDSDDGDFKPDSNDRDGDYSSMGSLDGGTLPIKYHIKKSITTRKNKNKNKPRTKSKTPARRITIRIKRLIKSKGSKVTRNTTCKQRATGGKRKSKPNKTMRRYRRVRK